MVTIPTAYLEEKYSISFWEKSEENERQINLEDLFKEIYCTKKNIEIRMLKPKRSFLLKSRKDENIEPRQDPFIKREPINILCEFTKTKKRKNIVNSYLHFYRPSMPDAAIMINETGEITGKIVEGRSYKNNTLKYLFNIINGKNSNKIIEIPPFIISQYYIEKSLSPEAEVLPIPYHSKSEFILSFKMYHYPEISKKDFINSISMLILVKEIVESTVFSYLLNIYVPHKFSPNINAFDFYRHTEVTSTTTLSELEKKIQIFLENLVSKFIEKLILPGDISFSQFGINYRENKFYVIDMGSNAKTANLYIMKSNKDIEKVFYSLLYNLQTSILYSIETEEMFNYLEIEGYKVIFQYPKKPNDPLSKEKLKKIVERVLKHVYRSCSPDYSLKDIEKIYKIIENTSKKEFYSENYK